jgi:methyl-accepting chemotaxis protein
MSNPRPVDLPRLSLSFSRRIWSVLSCVLLFVLLGAALGISSLQRVSGETAQMVDQAMKAERLAGDLHRMVAINVARAKAFALSSEPQVSDALTPEINATSVAVDDLIVKLDSVLMTKEDREKFSRMQNANVEFNKARQELTVGRDGGLTATIDRILSTRFNPAAQALLAAVTDLGDSQRARIDASVVRINDVSRLACLGLVLFGMCAMLVGGGLSFWLVRAITRPMEVAVATANRVAALDLSQPIEGHDRDEGGRLLTALAQMQRSLYSLAMRVQDTSRSVASGVSEIATGNLDVANRTELTASSLQLAASSIDEISTTMEQSLSAAISAEALAKSTAAQAEGGRTVMADVVKTMADIGDSSRQIVEITAVIDGIAFQTNILALNAAVEAARAGDQGRGFAVVAAEVRSLANRSAVASRQIKSLISQSASNVAAGTLKANQARDAMSDIVSAVQRVASTIEEMAEVTRSQSAGMASVNDAVAGLELMTQQNAAFVEESAAAAQRLQEQAGEMRDLAGQFRIPVTRLLNA